MQSATRETSFRDRNNKNYSNLLCLLPLLWALHHSLCSLTAQYCVSRAFTWSILFICAMWVSVLRQKSLRKVSLYRRMHIINQRCTSNRCWVCTLPSYSGEPPHDVMTCPHTYQTTSIIHRASRAPGMCICENMCCEPIHNLTSLWTGCRFISQSTCFPTVPPS